MNGDKRRVLRHPVRCGGIFLLPLVVPGSTCQDENWKAFLGRKNTREILSANRCTTQGGQKNEGKDGLNNCVFQFATADDTSATRRIDFTTLTSR